MLVSQAALAAGLLALPLAASSPTRPRNSIRMPLMRRDGKTTDDATLGEIYSDTDWITQVSIGGQMFNLQVDTGSSDLWLLSTLMPKDKQSQFPSNHFYDPTKSKTYKAKDGSSFNISYGDGSIYGAGKVGTDNVKIGSSTVNMEFGLGSDVSPTGTVDTTYDGILGLAFGGGNTFKPDQGLTFMEAVEAQLVDPVFTFNIPGSAKAKQMLEFGHIDHSLYTGNLATAKCNNGTTQVASGWLAHGSLSLNGKTISADKQDFLFDTGGLVGSARPDTVKAYWSQVKGAKDTSSGQDGTGWAAPCGGQAPDLTYDLDAPDGSKASATVPGSMMISTQTIQSDSSMCSGNLQSDGGSGGATIGFAFFRSQFTVFDQTEVTVSFAPYSDASKDGTAGTDSSSSSSASSSSSPSSSAASSGTSSGASSASNTASSGSSTTVSGSATKPTASSPAAKPTGTASGSGSSAAAATGSSKPSSAPAGAAPSASDAAPGGGTNAQTKSSGAGKVGLSAAMLAIAAMSAAFSL